MIYFMTSSKPSKQAQQQIQKPKATNLMPRRLVREILMKDRLTWVALPEQFYEVTCGG